MFRRCNRAVKVKTYRQCDDFDVAPGQVRFQTAVFWKISSDCLAHVILVRTSLYEPFILTADGWTRDTYPTIQIVLPSQPTMQ